MAGTSKSGRTTGDHAANDVHASLRRMILVGALEAGSVINQVSLAVELGVSRTPVREAVRRLQAEGLVEAEPQKKARVTRFDPAHCEALYTERILLEGVAATRTASRASDALIANLERSLDRLDGPHATAAWRDEHERFHLALVGGVHDYLVREIRLNIERTDLYRVMTLGDVELWQTVTRDHREIVKAFRARDGATASALLAMHLARGAAVLTDQLTPGYDLAVLDVAVAAMGGDVPSVGGRLVVS